MAAMVNLQMLFTYLPEPILPSWKHPSDG
jgi:hypothetical protein